VSITEQRRSEISHVWITPPDGGSNICPDPEGRFTIVDKDGPAQRRYLDLGGDCTYRTWLLYLAASAVGLKNRRIGAGQLLFHKTGKLRSRDRAKGADARR